MESTGHWTRPVPPEVGRPLPKHSSQQGWKQVKSRGRLSGEKHRKQRTQDEFSHARMMPSSSFYRGEQHTTRYFPLRVFVAAPYVYIVRVPSHMTLLEHSASLQLTGALSPTIFPLAHAGCVGD